MAATYEETTHYDGAATVRFYPGNHVYKVYDKEYGRNGTPAAGASGPVNTMNKGQGLMMWPMWEMSKYLKLFFETTTVEELIDDPDTTIASILEAGRNQHNQKADKGKSVGTEAHAWAEDYLIRLKDQQDNNDQSLPEVPTVENIEKRLLDGVKTTIKNTKFNKTDDFEQLPKVLTKEIEMQKAIHEEAEMQLTAINNFMKFINQHEIEVIGVEQTVYSREWNQCGKFDSILKITCSSKCGYCYSQGITRRKYTGTYLTDLKTTNESSEASSGIYSSYLPQCGIYDLGYTEEFGDKIDGYLILNASKQKEGKVSPMFVFERDKYVEWAMLLIKLRTYMKIGEKEVKEYDRRQSEAGKSKNSTGAKAGSGKK